MKRNLRAQMVGFHHPCLLFNQHQSYEYYEFLHEADEFGAAAGTYPDERSELLANSAHRYQLLVDWTANRLKLNVNFLNKGKIWFNFYSDIANHFGLGTQAYTTETRRPHVGISEISLQDIYLLQLILLHEMQHAIDFSNYAGLQMSISERELRARISICEGLSAIRDSHAELYANSLQDLCYWFILLFLTGNLDNSRKQDYFDLLNADCRYLLSSENGGILFSPLVLRSLAKELMRDNITLSSFHRYALDKTSDGLKLRTLSLVPGDDSIEEPDSLELMMLEDDKLASYGIQVKDLSKKELSDLSVDYSRELMTTRNRLTDWQSYDKAYENLKEQAKAAIERDKPSFSQVQLRLEKGAGHLLDRALFPQLEALVQDEVAAEPSTSDSLLASLALPDVVQQASEATDQDLTHGAISVQLEPLQGIRQRHNIEDDQALLPDMMADLSDFVRERGGR
ncbi:MAG: hypothetical protein ACAI44_32495 [Candidatus Sericytochromatia bacterium]